MAATASRVGDDIIITLPLGWIEQIIASQEFARIEGCKAEVVDLVLFADELVAKLNNPAVLDTIVSAEVESMIECGTDSLELTSDAGRQALARLSK